MDECLPALVCVEFLLLSTIAWVTFNSSWPYHDCYSPLSLFPPLLFPPGFSYWILSCLKSESKPGKILHVITWCHKYLVCKNTSLVPSPHPAPTQLSVTCSMEKWGEPGIFSHARWHNQKMAKICRTNRLCFVYCLTNYMLNTWCVQESPPTS